MRLKSERLHVSLHHIGDFGRLKSKFVHAARQAGNAVSQQPFEVTFRFIESFSPPPIVGRIRRRPLVLRGKRRALFELHSTLRRGNERMRVERGRGFRAAHDIALRVEGSAPCKPLSRSGFRGQKSSFRFTAELGLTRYTALGRCGVGAAKPRAAQGCTPLRARCHAERFLIYLTRTDQKSRASTGNRARHAGRLQLSHRATGSSIPRP